MNMDENVKRSGKPRSMFASDIATRIKLIRRSCTKSIDFGKIESDGENDFKKSENDPDFKTPENAPRKSSLKLKHKKRKYTRRRKRSHASNVVDLTKDVIKHHKEAITSSDATTVDNNESNEIKNPQRNLFGNDNVSCNSNNCQSYSLNFMQPAATSTPIIPVSSFLVEKENNGQKDNEFNFKIGNITGRYGSQKSFSPLSSSQSGNVAEKENNISIESDEPKEKIPRPPNAFMIFANEWRKHLAKQYPRDSNKTISVRLGQHWKILDDEQKQIYYRKAKLHDTEHKKKYPDYQYNPKEARIRKAQRDALKVAQRQAAASAVPLLQSPGYSPLSNTSRLDMSSSSPFISAYSSQQPLGQNVGSISGGGIINASSATSSSVSRPSSVVVPNTTPRRPPPPAYPGLSRQQTFHHGLETNHRDYAMGYGDSNFNPMQNLYPNNQSISSTSEPHTNGMFDSQYSSNTSLESAMWNGMSHNSNMWTPQNFEMQRQHAMNDYSPFQSSDQHSRNQLLPSTSTPTTGTLDDPNMFNHSEFPTDVYNYPKSQHPLNILTPKDLNKSIKTENHLDETTVAHPKDDLSTQRSLEQFPRTNTPMPTIPYNPNSMYKHETISHVASYHPKMSPKPHSDETRMSPYNRPNHSPKNGSKDLIHYRMSPKIFDNKLSSSPKSQKSPKSKHGNTSPSVFKFESSRKSPKAQPVEPIKREPSPEKHPLPAFTKAFSGTERGRLLATPENTNLSLVNTDTSDPLTVTNNPDFEFLNIDLFNEDNSKINFDEMNELNHNFSDTI